MDPDDVTVESQPDPGVVKFLEDRINEFNFDATGIRDGLGIQAVVRDDDGRIVAGIYGWTWGQTCEIQYLWVDERRRGEGLGSALLLASEREAAARECRQIVIGTHSFQASDFYLRFGYREVSVVRDYPKGHAHHVFVKPLSPP